jgi:HSP20 family protein
MKLKPFRPFSMFGWPSMMSTPSKTFEKDVDEFIRHFWDWKAEKSDIEWMPSVNVLEKPEVYLVTAELPGMEKDDVQVDLSGDVLTIKGERRSEEVSEDDHYRITECSFGKFQRSLTFPNALATDGVDAEMHNGILKIKLKKSKAVAPTKIKIKAH